MTGHALTAEQKRLVAELWAVRPMISVRLIGRRVTPPMGKGAIVSLVRRLGLPARPSPIRRGVTPKPAPPPKPVMVRAAPKPKMVRAAKPPPAPVVVVRAKTPKPVPPKPVVRRRALPKVAAVTVVPEPLPRGSGPLLWSFGCPACARRLFGPDQCAARLEAMAA